MGYNYIWIVGIVFFCLVAAADLPRIKGKFGEFTVGTVLSMLPKEEYHILNDVMIVSDGNTSQIDHIVISVYGIFVIETKNYKGWITGGEFSDKWTKNVYGKKYQFQNPVKQNYGHVKALEKLLNMPLEKFFPIVVFCSGAEIKVNIKSPVVHTWDLKREIVSHCERKIDAEEIDSIISMIKGANADGPRSRKEHIRKIKKDVAFYENKVKNSLCPRCGGGLIVRTGKYGPFMGCSNYPNCRFTCKIE